MKRALALLALTALAPGMGGCVAAIPIASAALMGESALSGNRAKDEAPVPALAAPPADIANATPTVAPEPVPSKPVEAKPVEARSSDARPAQLVETPKIEPAAGQGAAELPATVPSAATQPAMVSTDASPTGPTPSLASETAAQIGPTAAETVPDPVYDGLFATVTRIAQRLPSSREKRYSAILGDAGSLRPDRTECRTGKTAVLVDLDPANGLAPLVQDATASARLNRILDGLRAQDVAILWLSGRRAEDAVELRQALTHSGLDPTRVDPLYLVRFINESKSTRRADAAQDFCVVAVMGDAWQDFDPLFTDAEEPTATAAFSALIGDAWFLAPPPLDPKG
ncbi:hypothetical protein [Citromicrobium bathyomarinum]|uniref:hypothetical protein n=1 Tax=Citromicrobium bathyomarinum TaxID=72174 RepID=UPI00315B035C